MHLLTQLHYSYYTVDAGIRFLHELNCKLGNLIKFILYIQIN